MNSTRIISFTLCLGLACLLMMGNALAGTTKVSAEVKYAREVGAAKKAYVIPAGNMITRKMLILPSASFFVTVSLGGNAEFDDDEGRLPIETDLQTALVGGGSITRSLFGTPADGDKSVEYLARLPVNLDDLSDFPTLTLNTAGWGIQDPDNVLGGGGTINVTVTTRASDTGAMIDAGTDSAAWLKGIYGVTVTRDLLKSSTATIDVATTRTKFVAEETDDAANDNTVNMDKGATLGVNGTTAGVLAADGVSDYLLTGAEMIELVITGDLTGITEIVLNDDGVAETMADGEMRLAQSDEDFDLANGVATLEFAGDNSDLIGAEVTITIIVDGSTNLNPRTLNLAVNLDLGEDANGRELVSTSLTVWKLNGTVFLANFVNGNSDMFHSRVYLFNHGPVSGDITVRAFTLPTSGDSTLVGTADLGSLTSWSGRNIRVAEDVLMQITDLPYTADGGNLVLEITIDANNIAGTAQVFQNDLSSFGIYQLKMIN